MNLGSIPLIFACPVLLFFSVTFHMFFEIVLYHKWQGDRKTAPWKIVPKQILLWAKVRVWNWVRVGGNLPGAIFYRAIFLVPNGNIFQFKDSFFFPCFSNHMCIFTCQMSKNYSQGGIETRKEIF